MAAERDLGAWVEAMARDLVDRPDQVSVSRYEDEGVLVFELTVAPDELGRVIGRQGRTAQALRALLEAAGEKDGKSYDLEIVE
jgi:hypothetical protein